MNKIGNPNTVLVGMCETHVRIVASNSSRRSSFWFCRSDHFTDQSNSLDSLKHKSNDGARFHHIQGHVKCFLTSTRYHLPYIFVVMIKMIVIGLKHFCTDDFEASALKTAKYFSYYPPLNAVRFDNDKRSLFRWM